VVLTIAGEISDDPIVVGGGHGVPELLEVGGAPDEHVMVPGRQGSRDKPANGLGVNRLTVGPLARFLCSGETLDPSGVAWVVMDEADVDIIAILKDLEVGDEVVVAHVTIGGSIVALGDLAQAFFEVGDGVLETCHLGGVLGGPGLYGKCETVDELAQLCGQDVGMGLEGGQDGAGGQGRSFGDGGPSRQSGQRVGGDRSGRFVGQIDRVGGHGGVYGGFFPVGGMVDAKRCEESVRIEIEGVDWGVQFESIRALTFRWLLSSKGCLW